MRRRRFAFGAAAAAGVAAGAGFAVWRSRQGGEPDVDLWTSTFATPDGSPLAMNSLRGKPLLLNFWATWCPPCVTEMPMLDAFARNHPEWNLLALAIDAAGPVRRFLSERALGLRVALAQDAGPELARQLGNAAGGLPFSVAFSAAGRVAERKLGPLDEGRLKTWTTTVR